MLLRAVAEFCVGHCLLLGHDGGRGWIVTSGATG